MVKKKSSAVASSATSSSAAAKVTVDASKRDAPEVSAAAPTPSDWPASTMTKHGVKNARNIGLISSTEGNVILPAPEKSSAQPPKRPSGGFADEDDLLDLFLEKELDQLKKKLKEEEKERADAEAQRKEKEGLLRLSILALIEVADIPAGSKGKLPDNSSADALSMAIESSDLIRPLLQKTKGVMSRLHAMIFPKVNQEKLLEQLTDTFAVDTKGTIEDSINPKPLSEGIAEEHPRQLAPSVGTLSAQDRSSADPVMSSASSSTPSSPNLGSPIRFGSYEFTPHSDSSRSTFSDLQGNMEMTFGSVHYNVNAEGILQLLESPTSRSTSPGASSSLDLSADDEGSQRGSQWTQGGPRQHGGAAHGLAAPPWCVGAPQPLSPPFLRVLLRPENLSHRGYLTKSYSRLWAENTRGKELSAGRNPPGKFPPEGEIDAIAIVIELDIISIVIIIISTVYTAITTAAPRHRCNNLGIAMNEVRKKLFTISLSGKAAHWYKLLKNGDSLDWEDIVPLFYSKFYPPSEIHKDRNRIYNFWPHDGESIAQAWGRLKSLMLKCPIHELPGNVIIDNFYARLSFQDKTLLDTSCSGSFTRNKEEFKRDLLDRIQENTEGWENDKDRESGIIYDYKCIEAFMDTDEFRNMSATYGLDSQVAANLYKAFASHYELPKKNFDKYHEPYKDKIDSSINKCVVIETVDHVIPEAYIEKTPFPAKMKEYSVISSAVSKSEKKPIEPEEQIKIEPVVAIVKDLVTENLEDGHIIFCEDASNIVSHPNKPKQVSVPMLSVRIGDHCYYGLCDIGASVSAIPYELYTEIMHEIDSCELEDIDVVIQLANRETISPIGIVRDVEVLCGKIKYPADFLVLGSAASDHCPIIFGRPFLNTCGAIIDCKKEKILTKFAGEPYEFNFSKFTKTPYKADLPSNDFKMEQCASIVLVPNNPLQQHLENSESEAFRKERDELEEIFLRQPILKHDLPVEDLGTTPPPKEDPVFDLKPLPDNLKYAHIDDKKIYHVIISSKLSEIEEERLLEILKKHRGAIGYTLDDLKGISPSICQHAINMEDDAKPVVEHQRRLIPKMKEVVRNEVLKLLEAGIIYPIADSRWVSPVHCVPKKGGMTVVPNDNDELIPQRVVVGLENIAYDPVPVNDSFPNEQLAVIKVSSRESPWICFGSRSTMSSSGTQKDSFFEDVVNPYMNELKMHPKELLLVDGELQIKDVQGPKGEGSLEDRMEKLEQEVFNYKKMAEREVDIFHKIVSELIDGHKKETAKLWDDIFSLHDTTNKLQAQLYDVHNQNCEYENRFKRISHAASFRFPETKMSFVDGEPLPWKSDDDKDSPSSPKE
ncbi:hypothetical protein QYE76_065773 [Lolium multiflorum]|uniref:Retrotransposon gag domain-containing protein n=1 Tax=Lolium multiflorum TaxID=4521 RepID=A0AAD8SAY5_LOLMU|nr:hypothetical protein QYE76_065773 [Lolium multiflorum]